MRRRALLAASAGGGGGSSTITFYVETIPYSGQYEEFTADADMTWGDWVASDYNTSWFATSFGFVFNGYEYRVYYNIDTVVSTDDYIEDGHEYCVKY